MTRTETALNYFTSGYNCAQAVAACFADKLNMSVEQCLSLSSAFGGGLARTRGQCGTVSAMAMIIGMVKRQALEDKNADNAAIYEITRKAIDEFTKRNNTINCGELLKNVKNLTVGGNPDKRADEYYKIRPCAKFVIDAVEILEQIL